MKIFLILCGCFWAVTSVHPKESSWWQTAAFYQIYPRSFQDSDGDGVGDIQGIAQRLPYLKELGITATWLSPVFTSPMADFGYDIANFTEIDPLFGTMQDFDELMRKSKQIGVKLILDFVPNHSSDECEWFKRSVARDPDYQDFYVWHPGKIIDGVRMPPTNWLSVFRGSAWAWNEERQEYYLHQFHKKQPDLNYRNPKVVEAMKEVLRFWLRKGVAGFRVDALTHLFEVAADENGNWPDEPRNPNINDPEEFGYLQHIYTLDQPETIDMVYQFRAVMDEMKSELESDDLILMTEAYAPLEVVMQYYGNATTNGAQIPFNFELLWSARNSSTAYDFKYGIERWLTNMPIGRTPNWVLGNHDQNRVGTRLGEDRIDMMNILLAILPGCSVTYQGEEIGMTDVWISWEQTVDPQACNSNPELYEPLSRDPERTPFQWSDDKNAGFSTANTTWLPLSDKYKKVNVKRQRGIAMSHLNIYKQLQQLRANPTIRYGDTQVEALSSNILAVKRWYADNEIFIFLMNINDELEYVNLHGTFSNLASHMEYVIVTDKSPRRKGDLVPTDAIGLMPHEAIVLTTRDP